MSLEWHLQEEGFDFILAGDCIASKVKLEELWTEGRAKKNDNAYFIPHAEIASLTENEREVLELPSILPYQLRITTYSDITDEDFKYHVELLNPNGSVFVNPEILGAYVRIGSSQEYTFNLEQFNIISLVSGNEKKAAIAKSIKNKLKDIKDIKDNATKVDASIDSYLEDMNVVEPNKLSIYPTNEPSGDMILHPVLLSNTGEDVDADDEFKKSFARSPRVKDVYRSGNKYYVIDEDVKEGLQQVKDNVCVKANDVECFLANPAKVFTAQTFSFNIEEYSERVLEKGVYKYTAENSGGTGIAWLPEEGTTHFIENNTPFEVTVDNVEQVSKRIKQAQKDGKKHIEVDGKIIPITIEMINAVNSLKPEDDKAAPVKNGTNKSKCESKKEPKRKEENYILIIKDNFNLLDYKKQETAYKISEKIADCLNSNIALMEHQKEGVAWLVNCYNYHHGALLADDMGLGKTLQTLTFLGIYKSLVKSAKPVLIIAPVSLLKNWKEEYKKFLKPGIFENVVALDGQKMVQYQSESTNNLASDLNNKIVLMSYDTLRTHQFEFGKIEWSIMVLDEAQRIKNPNALVTLASKAMKYDFGICLTGTPIENTWVDLWSIMDFVEPGSKFGTLKQFKQEYISPLKKSKNDETLIRELGKKLNENLQPLFLRRFKSKLFAEGLLPDLPKKSIVKRVETMPHSQLAAYMSVIKAVDVGVLNKSMVLDIIAKLRDISLCPGIGSMDTRTITHKNISNILNSSARLKIVFQELCNIKVLDEKVLIFSESKKMQAVLRIVINKAFNIDVPVPINGDMDGFIRQRVVDEFNAREGFAVLILSPLAAGVGLNITGANHVIHLSRHWNPAKEDQATDRAYRIGQKKDVHVCIPMAVHPELGDGGSFDQKLDSLLEYKRKLSEEALFPAGDSASDGLEMFDSLINVKANDTSYKKEYYEISDVDMLDGYAFERVVAFLYANMNYESRKTPDSNDRGADVVAKSIDEGENYLIQCKKTVHFEGSTDVAGVAEIIGAKTYYEDLENCKFQCVVITNAERFTTKAIELAKKCKVKLIVRDELIKMLEKYPVEKIYVD